ncbi:MAG: AzlD domain-containing protein [Clostridiales bacterium]|nr:AzlD domain-containing protein [Clostridiales bacterium]
MTFPNHELALVAVVALCTFATRLFPFLLFGRKGEPSPIIRFLGKALPPAVMAILIIYCVRSVDFLLPASLLPQIISIAAVVLLHLWKRSNLLSIGLGTICYMLLIQYVF